ncbi:MAG: TonB-dependent receptor plug domain-containing protein [Bacteroidales bacterium]|nr:TonB-dependent receptor plug domain-containing protein [Bacteroidales bacterium]
MKHKLTILLIISLFLVNGIQAQGKKKAKKITLTGLVVDQQKNPIKNANIFLDGINTGVVTNEEGLFKVKVKPNVKTITVFTLFHGTIEAPYQGDTEITFTLGNSSQIEQDPQNIPTEKEEELVEIGYGTKRKRNMSSSIGEVNQERLKNARNYTTIYDMIKGEVPGVAVNGNSIIIRGVSSINLSSEPLYVVNGSPVSSIADISPNDVKSISVLKGSSAAIYGARGANGVIIITLKSAGN